MIYKEPFTHKIVSEDDYDELMAEYYGMFGKNEFYVDSKGYGHSPKTFDPSDLIYKSNVTTPSIDYKVTDKPMDKQVGGSHYKDMKIQPMEYILANNLGWAEGNVIKYTTRHRSKGGKQDLEKAIHMLQLIIDLEYKDA